MKVEQIYSLVNSATSAYIGKTAVLKEDLSNVADFGDALFQAVDVDNYVKTLVDKVGKVIFVDRVYNGSAPSVYMDNWEFGSVLQKIESEMPTAVINDSWDLIDKKSYDQDVFNKPKVSNKFYNSKLTFDIDVSFTELQVKSSFNSSNDLNSFLSMIVTSVNTSMTIKMDSLIMRTINSMIASTVFDGYGVVGTIADYGKKSTSKAVNLLYLYNQATTSTLKSADCLLDVQFLKFSNNMIELYRQRMTTMSTLFNVGAMERFTSSDRLVSVLLADYKTAVDSNLLSSVYNVEYVKQPSSDIVTFWQGSGVEYKFASTSLINVELDGTIVKLSGIIACLFDKMACGVCNSDNRVTTHHNARAEFYNNFYKFEASYFSDLNENFVVFFVHD